MVDAIVVVFFELDADLLLVSVADARREEVGLSVGAEWERGTPPPTTVLLLLLVVFVRRVDCGEGGAFVDAPTAVVAVRPKGSCDPLPAAADDGGGGGTRLNNAFADEEGGTAEAAAPFFGGATDAGVVVDFLAIV